MASLFDSVVQLHPLRPRQESAISCLRQAIREGHKRIILQAPTGSGKTVMAAHMIDGALAKRKKPLFAVPRISLINQTIKRFESQGICDIGVIQSNHIRTNPSADLQIASIQTMVMRELPDVDFVIIDECHLIFESMNKILDSEAWKDVIVIGLSATPWAKGMGRRWTKLVLFGSTKELIEEGLLAPVVGYGVPQEFSPDISAVRTVAGEYVEGDAEKAMTTQKIIGNVVKTWLDHGPDGTQEHLGDRTFLFCVNRSHAKKMQQEFNDAGIPCGYIDGTMDPETEREPVFKKYRRGEYKILASIDTVGIGIDEDVRCIIYCRLTKSEMKWVQDGGRGIRTYDGKEHCLLLDHAGTSEELGLFTDIYHETLDMRDPKEKGKTKGDAPPKPKKCPKCSYLVSRGQTACPMCGTVLVSPKSPKHIDGELIRMGKKDKKQKSELPMGAWYGGLRWIARERGYKDGWAAVKFKDKFGEWPRGLDDVPIIPPPPQVVSYEKYLRIRYAKARQKNAPIGA